MKRLFSVLFSAQLMAVIMGIFFVSIAAATFIENDFGSATAWAWVYNAPWFNAFLFIGIINLLGVIIKNKLYRKQKLTLFIFHSAFVLILTGAGITRFIGYEGTMFVREGQASDRFLLNQDYITLAVMDEGRWISGSKPVVFSSVWKKKLRLEIQYKRQDIKLRSLQYIPNAVQSMEPFPGGIPMAELVISGQEGRKTIFLRKGETSSVGPLKIAFDRNEFSKTDVTIFQQEDGLYFKSSFVAEQTDMTDQSVQHLPADSPHRFIPRRLYNFNGNAVVLMNYYPLARIAANANQQPNENTGRDALWVRVATNEAQADALVWKNADGFTGKEIINLGDTRIQVMFGPKLVKLPFSLYLTDFRIERYPGSNSPSWYESKVILQDSARGIQEPRRIYMNNLLKYKGFRFYQSSYDADEKGTILSVNHDLAGTLVTYTGYLLMAMGMALSLLNRNSRFRQLAKETGAINRSKKLLSLIIFMAIIPLTGSAQNIREKTLTPVNAAHAAEFGKLLIQDVDGRIEPLNTLSSQVLRKLYRKDEYRGMNSDQVFMGMLIDPETWQHEPIIRSRHPQIQEILGSQEKYFSFASFFHGPDYILQPFVEKAYRKKPAFRSKFDNEIIRLDERVNIAYLVYTGDMLRIFPKPGDSLMTWYTPLSAKDQFAKEDSFFAGNIISLYIEESRKSLISGNWDEPDKILTGIKNFQNKYGASVIPKGRKIRIEIYLNKSNLFDRISKFYGMIGFILLIYQFIGLFIRRIKNRVPVIIAVSIILVLFALHTAGLAMRWYVSGHAPWSNGYEALIYIAWTTVLAGIIFARRSGITLSATSVLAYLILHTAHLSWMDPQITSLVPVLKSYWLVVHVATITASYGFLALGALLASVNLLLMVFQNRQNLRYIGLSVKELSITIEMTLIVGLYLLAIGSFMGGVWANESWGRYWGWDPKETWALATIILYAFIGHMRLVPGLKGYFGFNLAALLGFSSVIMTYFGVNYYLSGLHSYAKGDPLPVPVFVYYTLVIIALVAAVAFVNQRRLHKGGKVM
jgi:cytochrome c-type biogenesis protein CcsB